MDWIDGPPPGPGAYWLRTESPGAWVEVEMIEAGDPELSAGDPDEYYAIGSDLPGRFSVYAEGGPLSGYRIAHIPIRRPFL